MTEKGPEATIRELLKPLLARYSFFLVDVDIKGGKETTIWIYVDSEEGGVGLDDAAELSNELGFLLDAHEVFSGRYRLNVSSPGLSRPLVDRRQYPKNEGRKARVKYRREGEYLKVEGILAKVNDDNIVIETENEEEYEIDFDQIVETKIIPSL